MHATILLVAALRLFLVGQIHPGAVAKERFYVPDAHPLGASVQLPMWGNTEKTNVDLDVFFPSDIQTGHERLIQLGIGGLEVACGNKLHDCLDPGAS